MVINNITIKKLEKSDINKILQIEKSQNVTILKETVILDDMSNSNNTLYFGAIYNDIIVGYIAITYVIDTIDILSIVTMKNYENVGVATLLLEYIFNFAKKNNVNKIFLEVRTSNTKAINLYEKNNFKLISKRKNYYTDTKEDALIYLKEIKKI
jgi:ribosomal-protein-alanine acetyltransferase